MKSPEKVTPSEAYQAFLVILNASGLTVIPRGRVFAIVESKAPAALYTEVIGPGAPVPEEERHVRKLIRLSHAASADVAASLQKLVSKDAGVSVHAPGNLLIVTDTGANLRRLGEVIEELDTGGAESKLWIEPLRFASPTGLGAKLAEVVGAGEKRPRFIAGERTRSLLVIGRDADHDRVAGLIQRLDERPHQGAHGASGAGP